jgi:hypothetical protein
MVSLASCSAVVCENYLNFYCGLQPILHLNRKSWTVNGARMGKCNNQGHNVIQYHRVFPLQFAGVAFCKSPKRDHVVGKLKCRGKFLHSHHCTHLSVLSCLLPETRVKNISRPDGGQNTKCAWKQYGHSWRNGIQERETMNFVAGKFRVGEELWHCTWWVAPQTTFIMEPSCRWSKLLVTHLQTFLHEFPLTVEHFFVPMLDYNSWQ